MSRALFDHHHELADRLPFVELADGLPTPVHQLDDRLWVQRDDLTSSLYGGNKVRKLEHLLAPAVGRGRRLVTAGATGSHHLLAVSTFGRHLGLATDAVVFPQPVTAHVERVVAALDVLEAEGWLRRHRTATPYLMPLGLLRRLFRGGAFVYPGASSPLGIMGHVGAGLELTDAFARADWPEPDAVVCAFGSGGTAVGLGVGTRMGGWRRSVIHAVRVTDAVAANRAVLRTLETGAMARLVRSGLPAVVAAAARGRYRVDGGWLGEGYGSPTARGAAAARLTEQRYGLKLEPTYTAKAFAAGLALHDAGARVVVVQTYAGRD